MRDGGEGVRLIFKETSTFQNYYFVVFNVVIFLTLLSRSESGMVRDVFKSFLEAYSIPGRGGTGSLELAG